MWLFVMFDLPVDTKKARRAYAQFRKFLLKDGFTQVQYSVYARVCASEENTHVHSKRVQDRVPDDGEVRLVCITDKQFERQQIFWGKMRKQPAAAPKQLEFF
jgi:CRISPR-associated protein Cas2